jgi:imidazolonepropionase
MIADLIIVGIRELLTPYLQPPIKGSKMADIIRIQKAFLAVKDGKIMDFGSGDPSLYRGPETVWYDAQGKIMVPGFVDGHTHLVFGGSREREFSQKVAGVPYLEILQSGGGIYATVEATRKAGKAELTRTALRSLDRFVEFGVTTLEAKSGYGLDVDTEIKTLEVLSELHDLHPIEIIPTFMGAHAIPKEFQTDRGGYMVKLMEAMKIVKARNLAVFADVFCEEGVFTPEESVGLLEAAREIGLIPKIHADEIAPLGGAGIAVTVEAASADHLMAIRPEDIPRLADSQVIANLLPGTSFFLNHDYANARALIDQGVAVGLASDYNPGSSPSENFQLILQIAAGKMRMKPEEILTASTLNPAFQLGLSDRIGSIGLGKQADFVLLDAPNWEYVLYHYGVNHADAVFKKGVQVVAKGRRIGGNNHEISGSSSQ